MMLKLDLLFLESSFDVPELFKVKLLIIIHTDVCTEETYIFLWQATFTTTSIQFRWAEMPSKVSKKGSLSFAGLLFVVLLGESAFVKKTQQTPCYYKSFEVLNHCERLLHSMYSYRAIGAASAVSRKRRLESFELAASFTSSEESRRRSGFEHLFFQIRNRVSLKYS